MADPRKLAGDFVSGLRRDLGDRMRSAALFGSAARDEWIQGLSDVNVLVLVDTVDAPLLARAAPVVQVSVKLGVTPLLMELDEWRSAADVFSIELADMKDAHEMLFGEDPVAHFEPNSANMRLQAEHELRAKLLRFHGAMLVAADEPKRLGQLLIGVLPSVATYLRAALRLAGQPVPARMPDVIEQGCRLVGADPAPFDRIHTVRTSSARLKLDLTDPLADSFNTSATRLAAYIDEHGR